MYLPKKRSGRNISARRLNQKLQTWKEYWGWVQGFYQGNLLADGWTKYSQATLKVVKAEDARPTLLKKLNRLGKLISHEWAKHDSVRKITTTDLKHRTMASPRLVAKTTARATGSRWQSTRSTSRPGDNSTADKKLIGPFPICPPPPTTYRVSLKTRSIESTVIGW